MKPYLSIVVPCFNEEQNIRLGALDKMARYLETRDYTWEVIIADDGSKDESVSLIKRFVKENQGFRLLARSHQGKAGTVIAGISQAKGEYVLFSDLDQATPLNQIEKMLPWFDQKFDIIIGSRMNRRAGAPFMRRLMGVGFMVIRNGMLGLGSINDTQCGFKVFKKNVVQDTINHLVLYKNNKDAIGPRVTAGFDVEMLVVAKERGYKIKEIPVEWHYVDTRRVSPLLDSVDALIDISRIKINTLLGKYR